jgi:predicted DNA-binding transcriptional regulator AlpA
MLEVSRFINKRQVRELCCLSYATIDRWEEEGRFPQRIVLASDKDGKPTRVVWKLEDVLGWLHDVASRTTPIPDPRDDIKTPC